MYIYISPWSQSWNNFRKFPRGAWQGFPKTIWYMCPSQVATCNNMYVNCLNSLCLINYLLAHIFAAYKTFMQHSLGRLNETTNASNLRCLSLSYFVLGWNLVEGAQEKKNLSQENQPVPQNNSSTIRPSLSHRRHTLPLPCRLPTAINFQFFDWLSRLFPAVFHPPEHIDSVTCCTGSHWLPKTIESNFHSFLIFLVFIFEFFRKALTMFHTFFFICLRSFIGTQINWNSTVQFQA